VASVVLCDVEVDLDRPALVRADGLDRLERGGRGRLDRCGVRLREVRCREELRRGQRPADHVLRAEHDVCAGHGLELAEEEGRKGAAQGLDATIINPANIIGPYDERNWSRMIALVSRNKLPGAPPGAGSFCHVREVAAAHITNGYNVPNLSVEVTCVGTNKTPTATYRGAGQPEACFPTECLIDVLAKEMHRSAIAIDVRAVGLISDDRNAGAQFPINMGCDFIRRAVGAIDHEPQPAKRDVLGKGALAELEVAPLGVVQRHAGERFFGATPGASPAVSRDCASPAWLSPLDAS